jgi:hypothetical protein
MSSSEWEEFFKMAGQYYVVGRFAAFAGLIPITGNLLHHLRGIWNEANATLF